MNSDFNWELQIDSEEAMMELGRRMALLLGSGDVVYISGELGAGKTTLVRGIARGLGYGGRITSPTFTLMNIYQSKPPIYHLDFYRLENREVEDLGLEDILEKEGICLIEWPVEISGVLPEHALYIHISIVDGDYDRERMLQLRAFGASYTERLKEMKALADSRN